MAGKPNIDELIKAVNEQAEITYTAQNVARKEQAKLNKLWQTLQDNCEHRWVPDHTQFDPCRTIKVCEICRMNR